MPLPKVCKEMLTPWRELLSATPAGGLPAAPAPAPRPVSHGIRLKHTLALAAKEKFKIVVVLREPAGATARGPHEGPCTRWGPTTPSDCPR